MEPASLDDRDSVSSSSCSIEELSAEEFNEDWVLNNSPDSSDFSDFVCIENDENEDDVVEEHLLSESVNDELQYEDLQASATSSSSVSSTFRFFLKEGYDDPPDAVEETVNNGGLEDDKLNCDKLIHEFEEQGRTEYANVHGDNATLKHEKISCKYWQKKPAHLWLLLQSRTCLVSMIPLSFVVGLSIGYYIGCTNSGNSCINFAKPLSSKSNYDHHSDCNRITNCSTCQKNYYEQKQCTSNRFDFEYLLQSFDDIQQWTNLVEGPVQDKEQLQSPKMAPYSSSSFDKFERSEKLKTNIFSVEMEKVKDINETCISGDQDQIQENEIVDQKTPENESDVEEPKIQDTLNETLLLWYLLNEKQEGNEEAKIENNNLMYNTLNFTHTTNEYKAYDSSEWYFNRAENREYHHHPTSWFFERATERDISREQSWYLKRAQHRENIHYQNWFTEQE